LKSRRDQSPPPQGLLRSPFQTRAETQNPEAPKAVGESSWCVPAADDRYMPTLAPKVKRRFREKSRAILGLLLGIAVIHRATRAFSSKIRAPRNSRITTFKPRNGVRACLKRGSVSAE
jgi:hypothetical protein